MKRILGMVVAIAALLAYSTVATAAPVTFNVSGAGGTTWSRSTDSNAAIVGPPQNGGVCTPGMQSPAAPAGAGNNCFRYPALAGSSVTVDITGSVVTMLGGTINLAATTPLVSGTIILSTNLVTTLYGATLNTPAAVGTLTGNTILWSTPVNVSTAGTLMCTGSNCSLISLPVGVPVPFEPAFTLISGTNGVTAWNLGEWDLNGAHSAIVASTNMITRWSSSAQLGNRRSGLVVFGTGLGNPVPEPASAALILLGLGALAVRSRKA